MRSGFLCMFQTDRYMNRDQVWRLETDREMNKGQGSDLETDMHRKEDMTDCAGRGMSMRGGMLGIPEKARDSVQRQ